MHYNCFKLYQMHSRYFCTFMLSVADFLMQINTCYFSKKIKGPMKNSWRAFFALWQWFGLPCYTFCRYSFVKAGKSLNSCFKKHNFYSLLFQQLSLKLIANCTSGSAPSSCMEISPVKVGFHFRSSCKM